LFAIVATPFNLEEGVAMFDELTEELLDLQANVRGYGAAVYAVNEDVPGSSSGLCCSVTLCCCCLLLTSES